jgi:sulfite oxidase
VLVHSTTPLNAEPALERLVDSFITPTDAFFKRNHAPSPAVDVASYRVVVDGMVERPLVLTLEDLRAFPRVELAATLQCAGNRRSDLIALAPTPGETPWRDGAIGTAVWGGVRLADVLERVGVGNGARHVAFLGMDRLEKAGETIGFGASIPLAKALAPEVMLADTMNGEPLRPEHGYPLRVIVPGFIGARSVKWLERITVQEAESSNHFQSRAYKVFPPEEDGSTADWDACASIEDYPVSSVIARPRAGAEVPAGVVPLRGYAITGAGRGLLGVEVSPDGGGTWTAARMSDEGNAWTWRLWDAVVELAPGEHVLVTRAWDDAGGQPAGVEAVWNFKGYLNNAWHRVRVVAR